MLEILLYDQNWNFVIKCVIAIVIISALTTGVKKVTPKIKGKSGEATVAMLLKRLSKEDYIVLNDIMLRAAGDANISTSQIDHVIVSKYGIFSIETKNYTGWITGYENSAKWTQTIYKTKNQFMNPIRQNYGHVKALEALLNENMSKCNLSDGDRLPIHPIVAFPGDATLKVNVEKADVVYWSQLVPTIKKDSVTEVITKEQMWLIADLLKEHNIDSEENRKEHVQNIREEKAKKKEAVAAGVCPKCGGSLVERSGKYGKFYGCSNYPNCKFTEKV